MGVWWGRWKGWRIRLSSLCSHATPFPGFACDASPGKGRVHWCMKLYAKRCQDRFRRCYLVRTVTGPRTCARVASPVPSNQGSRSEPRCVCPYPSAGVRLTASCQGLSFVDRGERGGPAPDTGKGVRVGRFLSAPPPKVGHRKRPAAHARFRSPSEPTNDGLMTTVTPHHRRRPPHLPTRVQA